MERGVAAALLAALLATACTAGAGSQPPPRDGRSGLRGTGTVEGRQVAVSTGLPQLRVGDCDPLDGLDDDICFIADTIGGETFVLLIENPAALREGVTLPVADPAAAGCATPRACDEVTDVAIVSIKRGTDPPITAAGGRLRVERVVPFTNYRGDYTLELPDGRFSGSFDVVPRPD